MIAQDLYDRLFREGVPVREQCMDSLRILKEECLESLRMVRDKLGSHGVPDDEVATICRMVLDPYFAVQDKIYEGEACDRFARKHIPREVYAANGLPMEPGNRSEWVWNLRLADYDSGFRGDEWKAEEDAAASF